MLTRLPCIGLLVISVCISEAKSAENVPPPGFRALFNGKDLQGWYGAGNENPQKMADCSLPSGRKSEKKSLDDIRTHWSVDGDDLVNDGHGLYLTTDEDFGDYELLVSYRTVPKADSGVYLKGTPQVQIWDWTDESKFKLGAEKGSGGLWNNSQGRPGKDPIVRADKPFGEWNSFRIRQLGARTTVFLNGKLVVDDAPLENYFDRKQPLISKGADPVTDAWRRNWWKNIFVREIPR